MKEKTVCAFKGPSKSCPFAYRNEGGADVQTEIHRKLKGINKKRGGAADGTSRRSAMRREKTAYNLSFF
jgi:hypothetical protein